MRAEPGRETVFGEFQAKNLASSSNDYVPPELPYFSPPGISVTHFASPGVPLDVTGRDVNFDGVRATSVARGFVLCSVRVLVAVNCPYEMFVLNTVTVQQYYSSFI